MFSRSSGIAIRGGTFISQTNHISRGMDILKEQVAAGALHNSDELYDAPKCHPCTRIAVLDEIMRWIDEYRIEKDYMLWLFGPAGAGKSAIAKRIAEITAKKGLLVSSFFFSRTVSTRNTKDHLIATLAYQLALSIPNTRSHIEDAVERDPIIFKKDLQTQIDTLLVEPLHLSSSTSTAVPSPKLIVIDGIDECQDVEVQVGILNAMVKAVLEHGLPFIFLITSRPEQHLVTAFNTDGHLKFFHRRLALDDKYKPDSDIRFFLFDKFERIKKTHPLKASIPISWPTRNSLNMLVNKSSGQFIYAATVIRFVESVRHRPTTQLDIVLGILPPSNENPFAQLDALYHRILSCVVNTPLTLRVLSVYVTAYPPLSRFITSFELAEDFLSLGQGDIQLALVDLPSIVSYEGGVVTILHASLVDFLLDRRRSTTFYIDMAVTNSDLARCSFRYLDRRARYYVQSYPACVFWWLRHLCEHAFVGPELRNDIVGFDLGAFIRNAIKAGAIRTKEILRLVADWMGIIYDAGLEDRDKQDALDRSIIYLKSQLQPYQSDPRLQFLVIVIMFFEMTDFSLTCRVKDILLGLDEHNLHLVDQNALDLRHADWTRMGHFKMWRGVFPEFCVDGDEFASLALQCLRFLADPSKYLESRNILDSGAEWSSIISSHCALLCWLLQKADPMPELLQFFADHNLHPVVKQKLPVRSLWNAAMCILAFLSRTNVCANWWIVFAIQLGPIKFTRVEDHRAWIKEMVPFFRPCSGDDPCCLGYWEEQDHFHSPEYLFVALFCVL